MYRVAAQLIKLCNDAATLTSRKSMDWNGCPCPPWRAASPTASCCHNPITSTAHNYTVMRRDAAAQQLETKELDEAGRLSFEQFMGEESRAEKLFRLMDKDGDGYVTKNVSRY